MSTKEKNTSTKRTTTKKNQVAVSENVGNYEKHPFFIKKNNAAKALLLKVGLPKELTKKASA